MDLQKFAEDIATLLNENIPEESDENFVKKHLKREMKLKDAIGLYKKVIPIGTTGYVYEIGNSNLESKFPHYHILEDAYTIKKRSKGTEKSKGSQAKVSNLGKRDYGIEKVTYKKQENGTFRKYSYQEYRKNVRGNRKPKHKYAIYHDYYTKNDYFVDVSDFYTNKHYHYIEKTLEYGLSFVASKNGLKMKGVNLQESEDILNIE